MKKKIFALLLCVCMMIALCGCVVSYQVTGASPTNAPAKGTITARFLNKMETEYGPTAYINPVSDIVSVRVQEDSVIKIEKDGQTVQQITQIRVVPFAAEDPNDVYGYGLDLIFDYAVEERGEYKVKFDGVSFLVERTSEGEKDLLLPSDNEIDLIVTHLGTEDDTIPETGDEKPILLWSLLLLGSAGALLLLRKKQRV